MRSEQKRIRRAQRERQQREQRILVSLVVVALRHFEICLSSVYNIHYAAWKSLPINQRQLSHQAHRSRSGQYAVQYYLFIYQYVLTGMTLSCKCCKEIWQLSEVQTENGCYVRSRWLSGRTPDCGARGPRFESHRIRLCLSRQSLRYTALGTGCVPLLQCLGRLSLLPSVGR